MSDISRDAGNGRGKTYEVDQWTVIMAIRYGTGRMTYANSDAALLARLIWPDLTEQQRDQIKADAQRIANDYDRKAWEWLLRPPREA